MRLLDLTKVRQQQDISLEQISESTKISLRFLRAIEAEDFDQLPGGIFNTSYLRQYAAAIGYDASKLLAHYNRVTGNVPEPVAIESPQRSFIHRWLRASPPLSRA